MPAFKRQNGGSGIPSPSEPVRNANVRQHTAPCPATGKTECFDSRRLIAVVKGFVAAFAQRRNLQPILARI